MTSFVLLSCLLLAWPDPPQPASDPPEPSPADLVAAIETVMADAIAKAEPSVVAIHRIKGGELAGNAGHPRPEASAGPARAGAVGVFRRVGPASSRSVRT